MNRNVTILLGCILFFSSCHYIEGRRYHGDGNVITASRNISDFKNVQVSGAITLVLSSDSAYSVKVEIDENLQDFIEVYKEGETLLIHQANNTSLDASGDIKVYVSAPKFESLDASGACKVIGNNTITSREPMTISLSGASNSRLELKAPAVDADLSGASTLNLKGETKDFIAKGSGSSDIKCFDLLTESTRLDLSGASRAQVFASVKLDIDASGASSVRYKGNASVNSHTSGASSASKSE